MTSGVKVCLDRQIMGECTKKQDCPICNNNTNIGDISNGLQNVSLNVNDLNLNKNAKGYVPKSKRNQEGNSSQQITQQIPLVSENKSEAEKLNLNLNAKEYVPKCMELNYTPEFYGGGDDDDFGVEEFDMIMKDIIDNEVMEELEEEDEDDEDRWFPKYKECDCCKGFVYKCKGVACEYMDACYCKVKDECDEEAI